jgi:endonuclease/exonuclease/phosphatase family metal-dependent hydrolase
MRSSSRLATPTLLLIAYIAGASAADAGRLRVAAWNIADLHHEAGVELRPDIGTRRSEADFSALQKYADGLDADIVALQEIGTREGAERLFPKERYHLRMSGRYDENLARGIEDGIYTAVAVRRKPDLKILQQNDLAALSVGDGRYSTRRGTALLLDVDGTRLWILSVHLKSSCSRSKSPGKSSDRDCQIFWQQRLPLKAWIDERRAEGIPFVIAGDFNRRFRLFESEGPFWQYLNTADTGQSAPAPSKFVRHPETVKRLCPTRKGRDTQPIDWILLPAEIAHWYQPKSFWETRFSREDAKVHGQRLSDHCPIHIDLKW